MEENLCLIKKFINVVQSLVQSGWEAYCSYQNLLTHMTEITEIYVEIYDNVFLVYLIRKKDFQEKKRKQCFTIYCLIIHECTKIFDKNSAFCLLFLSIINQHGFWKYFLTYRLDILFVFITKNSNASTSPFFFDFLNVFGLDGKLYVCKVKFFCRIFVNFSNSSWIMSM